MRKHAVRAVILGNVEHAIGSFPSATVHSKAIYVRLPVFLASPRKQLRRYFFQP